MNIQIRPGTASDLPAVHGLIMELAEYERAPEEVSLSLEQLISDGKLDNPLYRFLVAESDTIISGIALYYFGYSTWKGKLMYLDDLIVTEDKRKLGIGKLLFDELMRIAKQEDARQIRWHVLDWNDPAIKFYEKLEAELDPEWICGKLSEAQIQLGPIN